MAKMKTLDWVAITLLLVGGLNWGLVGAFDFNLVEIIPWEWLVRTVYVLVGAASIYSLYTFLK